MFLGLPKNGRTNKVADNRASGNGTTSPIGITVCSQNKKRIGMKKNALARTVLEISNYSKSRELVLAKDCAYIVPRCGQQKQVQAV